MDQEATASFLAIAHGKGWETIKSVGKEDWNEHWDWYLSKQCIGYHVDLKAMKRINSSDPDPDESLILIELQAVKTPTHPIRKGWLYGLAEYICFEMKDKFIFVQRHTLQNYVENNIKIDTEPVVSTQNKQAHIIYTRQGRNDKFVYFYNSELLKLTDTIWRKYV